MNSLLKRQIRKYFAQNLHREFEPFLDAINRSYDNFDDQFVMLQRAMSISSDELFEANQKLLKETKSQQEVIDKLKKVIDTLDFYKLPSNSDGKDLPIGGNKLVDLIDKQTKEIIEMNKQREKLLQSLAHQNEELSEYAHMVSHDLKSPLRSINTLVTWLDEDYKDELDDKGRNTLKLIGDNVEKMDVLISGVLEYSTIGKTKIEMYDVDINTLLKDIIKIIYLPENIEIQTNNVSFPVVKGDKYRLQQLFQNLIGNAIKYNDKSVGIIEIGFEDIGKYWQFYIKDNGIGIEERYFEKIFKTFEKLEVSLRSSGIGLSIVKKIVTLYEGKVWVESEPEIGSTFYFTLKK